jgi:hypothetical protein
MLAFLQPSRLLKCAFFTTSGAGAELKANLISLFISPFAIKINFSSAPQRQSVCVCVWGGECAERKFHFASPFSAVMMIIFRQTTRKIHLCGRRLLRRSYYSLPLITCELENYFALFFNLFPFYYFPTFLAGSALFLFYLCGAVKFTLLAQVNLLLQAAAPSSTTGREKSSAQRERRKRCGS